MTPRPSCIFVLFLVLSCAGVFAQSASAPTAQSTPSTHGRFGITEQSSKPATQAAPPNANPGDENAALAEADRLLTSGKAAEAQAKYQAVANVHPASVPAQIGVLRALIVQQKLAEAQSVANTALALNPESSSLLLTVGDLQFAQGKIPDAERSFVKAQNLAPDDAAPYLALARVYRAYSLFRRAYDNLKRAHEVAPNDPTIQLLWFNSLPHQYRIAALQAFLATPTLTPKTSKMLEQYLAFVKKNAGTPEHPCKLISNVQETETKLHAIARAGSELGAVGLTAKINNQELHLAVDTGASGVLLGRAAAEKLGLQRLAYQSIMGMGESGKQGGYTALASRIRVGDLEFSDCTVRVTDAATPVTGQDGLIGSDVFSSYLINIDIPGAKLRLSPLPKRPDEAAHPPALKTISPDAQELEAEDAGVPAGKTPSPDAFALPMDAYVAPEMVNWSKVYRFRHLLLVPTRVDKTGPMLFLIDTGSFSNVLSTLAAKELTQLRSDPATHVSGLSGSVAQVYRADKATLQFGRYEQDNQDVVTFDLSNISRQTGTQVSGILGFNMLRILQLKIDYRDGLVDFIYDPKHLPKQVKLNQ